MRKDPSQEADSRLASQEIYRHFVKPENALPSSQVPTTAALS
jgi:hypothetical protein